MDFDGDKLYNYINRKYNLKIDKSNFSVLLDKYKTDTKYREIYNRGWSEVQFCTTERPQSFQFDVATCRTCRLKD